MTEQDIIQKRTKDALILSAQSGREEGDALSQLTAAINALNKEEPDSSRQTSTILFNR